MPLWIWTQEKLIPVIPGRLTNPALQTSSKQEKSLSAFLLADPGCPKPMKWKRTQ